MSFAGNTAIIGVGASSFERRPDGSAIEMAGTALAAALRDAGIEKRALDGLVVQIGSPRGADYDSIAQTFGLDLVYCGQTWAHGRFTTSVILQAAMAIASGLCSRVACILAMKNSDLGRIGEYSHPFHSEQFREGGGPHGEEGWIGMSSPVAGAAMAFNRQVQFHTSPANKSVAPVVAPAGQIDPAFQTQFGGDIAAPFRMLVGTLGVVIAHRIIARDIGCGALEAARSNCSPPFSAFFLRQIAKFVRPVGGTGGGGAFATAFL